MSTQVPQSNDDQEIDLVQISKKISNFFDGINRSIFRGIQFFVRNWIIFLLLFIAGFGVGLFLDKTQKQYDNKIIVEPNFGSVDYLYSKIDFIQSKIQTNDTEFFKAIGISNVPKISKISIEPIVDVFKFVNNNEQNLEVLKLMTANGDLKSIINETTTVKNYPFYIISFSTDGLLRDQSTAAALLNYINTSKYYSEVQKIRINNIRQRIKENDEVVAQIDGILNKFSSSEYAGNQKNDKLVYYNENTQLNDLIKTKDGLLRENADLKLELATSDKIVKESSIVTNIENDNSVKGKTKFLLPFLFICFFIFVVLVKSFYKKQQSLLR